MGRLNTNYSERDQTSVKTTLRQVPPKKATYKLERAPDEVGGYCILRYTPGPPGYVSIVVIKRADADDPGGRGCCVQSAADDKLLPSKPSSVVDFAEEASPADPAAEA